MSLKENVEAIKKELSTEEQFLESVIKAEGFFKKYKKLLIAGAILLIVIALGYTSYQYIEEKNLNDSNQAYNTLQNDSKNSQALEVLKSKNSNLYQLFVFTDEVKSADAAKLKSLKSKLTDPILLDLVSYQEASLTKKELANYSMKQDAMLKDFTKLQEVYMLLKDGQNEEASKKLLQIPVNSPLQQISQSLKHYSK